MFHSNGGVAEWLNAAVSKTVYPVTRVRGFESLLLRHHFFEEINYFCFGLLTALCRRDSNPYGLMLAKRMSVLASMSRKGGAAVRSRRPTFSLHQEISSTTDVHFFLIKDCSSSLKTA